MRETTIEKTQKDRYQTDIRLKQTDRRLKSACVIFTVENLTWHVWPSTLQLQADNRDFSNEPEFSKRELRIIEDTPIYMMVMIYDGVWWCMIVYDGLWWSMMVYDGEETQGWLTCSTDNWQIHEHDSRPASLIVTQVKNNDNSFRRCSAPFYI